MKLNALGKTQKDYIGAPSTLCTGCGHDSVTQHIIAACFQSNMDPTQVAKLSGIGCSSKTTNYFMNESHGFNSIHGRMGAIATGAALANRNLRIIGVSGDGDTASIGLGGFLHLLRRNVPMVYIVENNGVYGLTKGQFSATAEQHMRQKSGAMNAFPHMDLCALAVEAGCHFVARSFSGDGKQLVPLIAAAMAFPGTAFIEVVSPCITYANHEGSTKSYDYVRSHKVSLQELGFIQSNTDIKADYAPGQSLEVTMPNGSRLLLKKLDEDHNHTDPLSALSKIHQANAQHQVLTGLLYYNENGTPLPDTLNLSESPLSHLTDQQLVPTQDQLDTILKDFQ